MYSVIFVVCLVFRQNFVFFLFGVAVTALSIELLRDIK